VSVVLNASVEGECSVFALDVERIVDDLERAVMPRKVFVRQIHLPGNLIRVYAVLVFAPGETDPECTFMALDFDTAQTEADRVARGR
ncbi:MAG: hypothetical protein WBD41_29540, partial [Rhodococcus sp. (in: high G+C Gram-positive bacteria)]